jgi:hypothetical protein
MPARSHSPKRAEPPWLAYRDAHRSLNQRSDLFGDISATLTDHKGGFFLWPWGHCWTRVARPINPNTGLANGWHRVWTSKRALTLLSQIASPQDDIVFAGDFNVLSDSETLAIFADWGLRDLVGQQDTRTALCPKAIRHANYMLVTASVDVKSFEVPANPVVSDHRPLILSIS